MRNVIALSGDYKKVGDNEEFFDDRFREDMIMTISEEERQKQIRKEQDLWRSVVKWSEALKDRNE